MTKKTTKHKCIKDPQNMIDLFETATKDLTVEHRKMSGYPFCFINGNMFTGLHGKNMIIRLSEKDKEIFLKIRCSKIFKPMPGRFMKEYVVLPASVKNDTKLLAKCLKKSLEYARSLPRKRKKQRKNRSQGIFLLQLTTNKSQLTIQKTVSCQLLVLIV